jgi:hypothetical protein
VVKRTRNAWILGSNVDNLLPNSLVPWEMAISCAYLGRNGLGRLFVRLLPDRLRLLSSLLHALGTRASHHYCSIIASRRSDRDLCAIAKI